MEGILDTGKKKNANVHLSEWKANQNYPKLKKSKSSNSICYLKMWRLNTKELAKNFMCLLLERRNEGWGSASVGNISIRTN